MAKIFISHSSKNKGIATDIAKKIGLDVCIIDQYTFEVAEKTINEILSNLDATDILVLLISNASLDSDWVKREISETKLRLDKNQMRKILPFIIDKSIDHNDVRIPEWLKEYNLKPILNHNIIINKIKRHKKELELELNPKIKERNEIFIGRNYLFDEFENKLINIQNLKPTTILINGLEGVGRRSYLLKAFEKHQFIKKNYEPYYITLEYEDGIDDLILKLEDGIDNFQTNFIEDLNKITINDKVKLLKRIYTEYLNNNEYIFIIDKGCIFNQDKVKDWFIDLANLTDFENRISFIVISKYRPSKEIKTKLKYFYLIQDIPVLSDNDKEKLFIRYLNYRNISFNENKKNQILELLNGIPSQVFYTVDLIEEQGIDNTLSMKNYIIEYGESTIYKMLTSISNDTFSKEILTLLTTFDTISYDYLSSIILDKEKLDTSLDFLYYLGTYDLVGPGKEFIKINYVISDYIKRNKYILSFTTQNNINEKVSVLLNDDNHILEISYSDYLSTIKQAILNKQNVPENMLLPSLILKSIIALYNNSEYQYINVLANRILENSNNIELDIQWNIKYYLCLALARLKSNEFMKEVSYFTSPEYDFLMGFYCRLQHNYLKAREYLEKAVSSKKYKRQARSELVLVLISLGELEKAKSFAQEMYLTNKTNPYYIYPYFKTLIKIQHRGSNDINILNELIEKMTNNPHPRASSFLLDMQGEYEFFINKNFSKAVELLKKCIEGNNNKTNPINSLIDIYRRQHMYKAIEELKRKHPNAISKHVVDY